jgi:signal transduction histidine kinase
MNLTERKKLEQRLICEQINHQKQLTQATIDGQEKERTEVGKELHDNIGQQLTTVKLYLDMAKSGAASPSNPELLDMALKGVSDLINEVRAMSRSLVPPTLRDLGLIDSLHELVSSISRVQVITINLHYEGFEEESLEENKKLMFFRIIQEQLNNIIKHANATRATVSLAATTKAILLQIKDDGKGFDPKTVCKGIGFTNIRNRAELFGGKLEIISSPGKGSTVKVSIPQLHKVPA